MGLTKNLGWLSKYITADSSGNIGLGVTPTLGKLQITGGDGVSLAIKNTAPTITGSEFCQLTFNNTTNASGNFESAKIKVESTNGGSNQSNLIFENSGAESMRITPSGNILINAQTELGAKLQVEGVDDVLQLRSTDATKRTTMLLSTNGYDWEVGARGSSNPDPNIFYIYNNDTNAYRFLIDALGNVLIGTTARAGAINTDTFRSNLILGASNSNKISFNNGATTQTGYVYNDPAETSIGYPASGTFNIQKVGVGNVMTVTSGGNMGLGVTPSSWDSTVFKSLDIGGTYKSSFFAQTNGDWTAGVSTNLYYNSGWKYANNGSARLFEVKSDSFNWYTASSGTAGNAATLTPAMIIASNGNVLINTTGNAGYKLDVNGAVKVNGNFNYNTGDAIYPRTTAVGDWYLSKHNQVLDRIENALGTNGPFTLGNHVGSTYTANIFFYGNGAATFNQTVTATAFIPSSDIRLKNLTDYDYDVKSIKPITYTWKDSDDKRKKIGYSAQEVREVLPDAVNEDDKGMLSVDYNQIFVAKIDMLENIIQELKSEIEILKNK